MTDDAGRTVRRGADHDVVELHATGDGRSTVARIRVDAGGRVEQVGVTEGHGATDLLAVDDRTGDGWRSATSSGWGSFPMAPWAGRIRNGRFAFLGHTVRLAVNHDDGTGPGGAPMDGPARVPGPESDERDRRRHSIHGTTFTRRWHVDDRSSDRLVMSCRLDGALEWPFAGTARQEIRLSAESLSFVLEVSADHEPFPAAVGWHPWFDKPDAIDFSPVARYELDDVRMPTGRLVVPGSGPWDDCFVNHEPVVLRYDRAVAPVVTVTSDCDHVVVYDRPHHATCVEPQSGPPDAPNVRPELVLPGRPLRRTMEWAW